MSREGSIMKVSMFSIAVVLLSVFACLQACVANPAEDKLDEKINLLAEFPGMGARRDELSRGLRSFPVGNYLLFYRPTKTGIEVIRIAHGARDLSRIFKRRR